MEIHRLKPMPEGYDVSLFNDLYSQTENLRKSLAYQIDARRLGVTPDLVLSWFDDKFIFVFSTYFGKKEPNLLKGYIINSLRLFKYRILRKAYQPESLELYGNTISLDDPLCSLIEDETYPDNREILLGMALDFFKERLTDEAIMILGIQIDPPTYITSRMVDSHARIPSSLILDFLGFESTKDTLRHINRLRRQIEEAIQIASSHFEKAPLSF